MCLRGLSDSRLICQYGVDHHGGAGAEGDVVAVGRGRMTDARVRLLMDVRPGVRVVVDRHQVEDVRVNGEDLLFVRQPNVLAVIDDPPDGAVTETVGVSATWSPEEM